MKRTWKQWAGLALACALVLAASGCDTGSGGGGAAYHDQYIIMFYGAGGGNLDNSLAMNLAQVLDQGVTDRVKFTAEINWSAAVKEDIDYPGSTAVGDVAKFKGTRRFHAEPGKKDDFVYDEVTEVKPLYEPEELADFIRWSKQKYPEANKYILVLWDHGGGWTPGADGEKASLSFSIRQDVSPAVIYDDNFDKKALSVTELAEGIRRSDTTIDVLYYDACLMSMLENLAELQPVADYVLSAGNSVPGYGGQYDILIQLLDNGTYIEQIFKDYVEETVKAWVIGYDQSKVDLMLTDLSKIPAVLDVIKDISGVLSAHLADDTDILVTNQRDIVDAAGGVYFYDYDGSDSFPRFADIYHLVTYLAKKHSDWGLDDLAKRLEKVMGDALISGWEDDVSPDTTYSVTYLGANNTWAGAKYNNGAYKALAFDKATGWSTWLKGNKTTLKTDETLWK